VLDGAGTELSCAVGARLVVGDRMTSAQPREAFMTTPPDFGGLEIENGVEEDLGGPREVYQTDEGSAPSSDNEAHAGGQVCELCGAVITPGQNVRRRADGQWMHEVCPWRPPEPSRA